MANLSSWGWSLGGWLACPAAGTLKRGDSAMPLPRGRCYSSGWKGNSSPALGHQCCPTTELHSQPPQLTPHTAVSLPTQSLSPPRSVLVPSLCAMAFNLSLCSDSRQTCSSPVPCPLHLASWRLSVIKFCVPGHPGNQYCSNFICVCSSNFKKNLQSTKENYFYISLYHEHTRGWTNVLQKLHLTHNDGVQCGSCKSFPFYSGWVNFISGH